MRVCVLNQDEAWFVENEEAIPDCRFHCHWTRKKAMEKLVEGGVRIAKRSNTVVLVAEALRARVEKRAYATDWHPRISAGCPVWQFPSEG